MSEVGDVITTAEELDALPVGSVIIDHHRQALVRWRSEWGTDGVEDPLPKGAVLGNWPFTIVYLPGQPPRPERVVKAEALREFGETWSKTAPTGRTLRRLLFDQADRVERGES